MQGGPVRLLPGTVGGPRSGARFVGACGRAEPTEGQTVQSLVSWRASSSRVGASATRSGGEEGGARAYACCQARLVFKEAYAQELADERLSPQLHPSAPPWLRRTHLSGQLTRRGSLRAMTKETIKDQKSGKFQKGDKTKPLQDSPSVKGFFVALPRGSSPPVGRPLSGAGPPGAARSPTGDNVGGESTSTDSAEGGRESFESSQPATPAGGGR